MKNILVIGGGLFVGRVFNIVASERKDLSLHVVNRGRHPLNIEGITEYVADRHDPEALKNVLPKMDFDAIVDFCALEPGDINTVLKLCGHHTKKYIYISTCSVYMPQNNPCTEDTAVISRTNGTTNGDYVYKKLLLERELMAAVSVYGIEYVIFRPAFIYGPFNYASRDSLFVRALVHDIPLPVPTDSTSKFQMVYVKDVANAILAAIDKDVANGKIYNISAPEEIDYERMASVLIHAHGGGKKLHLPAKDLFEKGLPLPFPVMGMELYDGSRAVRELGLEYTSFEAGMTKMYNAFKDIFS